ncbi:MAG: ribonuclease P protein component [Alphaproteobacteria bacterium]|nr:ribonuclease P protein component [Alphaproteobacteria bacterium]
MPGAVGRIKRRSDFLRVAGSGRRWVTPGLILQAHRSGSNTVRVGFTVTKRIGNAVARNRVRRRLRAVAAQVLPAGGPRGFDLVMVGRRAAAERPYLALVGDLETALRELRRWDESRA